MMVKSLMILRKELFEVIANIISDQENSKCSCVESEVCESWNEGRDFCTNWGINTKRTYTVISESKEKLFCHTMIRKAFFVCSLGTKRKDSLDNLDLYLPFEDIITFFQPLYVKYPYLQSFFERVYENYFSSRTLITKFELQECYYQEFNEKKLRKII